MCKMSIEVCTCIGRLLWNEKRVRTYALYVGVNCEWIDGTYAVRARNTHRDRAGRKMTWTENILRENETKTRTLIGTRVLLMASWWKATKRNWSDTEMETCKCTYRKSFSLSMNILTLISIKYGTTLANSQRNQSNQTNEREIVENFRSKNDFLSTCWYRSVLRF